MATMTTGRAVSSGQTLRKHLSLTDGFVLYTSAVLGQSLIVLPSIAARRAGPWSILVWAALAAVSYPLARIMAELGARYPSAGGVIAFIGHGLGQRIGWLTGILYLAAIAGAGPATPRGWLGRWWAWAAARWARCSGCWGSRWSGG